MLTAPCRMYTAIHALSAIQFSTEPYSAQNQDDANYKAHDRVVATPANAILLKLIVITS